MTQTPLFHFAFAVHDLAKAEAFYHGILGCRIGRRDSRWIDFDFSGHQITAHLSDSDQVHVHNPVDTDLVPIPHFGLILDWSAWHKLAEQLEQKDVDFIIKPRIRFRGEAGEQATMFVRDPSGNCLEFKSFQDASNLFKQGD